MKKILFILSILFILVGCSKKIVVANDKAPKAIGPYNQAIIYNDMVYCSGQIAIDPSTSFTRVRKLNI